jgi:hypothetical protein
MPNFFWNSWSSLTKFSPGSSDCQTALKFRPVFLSLLQKVRCNCLKNLLTESQQQDKSSSWFNWAQLSQVTKTLIPGKYPKVVLRRASPSHHSLHYQDCDKKENAKWVWLQNIYTCPGQWEWGMVSKQ